MTSLMFGMVATSSVPVDEATVRSNTYPVDPNSEAEQTDAPDLNEVETDPNPTLGLVNRQLYSHVIPTVKYPPFWQQEVDDNHLHTDVIDRQVGSSGTAAAREAAGQFGHGTMMVVEGIEPVQGLTDGGRFGNQYFAAGKPDVQSGMPQSMSIPPGYEHANIGVVADTGKSNARAAQNRSLYAALAETWL
jgi:hypothetical protein